MRIKNTHPLSWCYSPNTRVTDSSKHNSSVQVLEKCCSIVWEALQFKHTDIILLHFHIQIQKTRVSPVSAEPEDCMDIVFKYTTVPDLSKAKDLCFMPTCLSSPNSQKLCAHISLLHCLPPFFIFEEWWAMPVCLWLHVWTD